MVKKRIPKKINKIVQNYIRRLSKEEKLPIKKVIIFGSQVKGNAHAGSDIDVCVISPKFKDTLKAIEFLLIKRKKEEVMAGIEPIGFTKENFQEGGTLIEEIKKTGVRLK